MQRFAIIIDGKKRIGTATFAYIWGMYHVRIEGFKPEVFDNEREALEHIAIFAGEGGYELEEVTA